MAEWLGWALQKLLQRFESARRLKTVRLWRDGFLFSLTKIVLKNWHLCTKSNGMKIYPIETGNLKLDGGGMFGVVPKSLWQRTNPADSNNMIDLAMRCLLIEDGDRLILIDTGLGNKQSEKFFSYYYLFGDFSLDISLAKHGFHHDDITDVFLTHLHFDHCGGAIEWNKDKAFYQPSFKNAKFWSNQDHWKWATIPNNREKASFLKENINPIEESGQLHFLNLPKTQILKNSELGFDVFLADGHTEKQNDSDDSISRKNACFYGRFIANYRTYSFTICNGI